MGTRSSQVEDSPGIFEIMCTICNRWLRMYSTEFFKESNAKAHGGVRARDPMQRSGYPVLIFISPSM